MKAIVTAAAVLLLLGVSCADVEKLSSPTLVIRGKAMTGAHTRTPVAGGFVGMISPEPSTWMRLSFAAESGVPNKTVTAADGSFTFLTSVSTLTLSSDYATFLAVSDAEQTFTMMTEIPHDLAVDGAQLQLDINPTTTAAAELICPGGVYPPPSGAYCYSDPNHASTTRTSLMIKIDASLAGTNLALEPGATSNWRSFMTTLLSDTTAFADLKAILQDAGLTSNLTAAGISNAVTAVPKITKPIYGVDDNTPADDSSTGSCGASWSCGSSQQCKVIMGGASGTKSGFSDSSACQSWCTTYIPGNCSCSC